MSTDLESRVRSALHDAVAGRASSDRAWSRLAEQRARSVKLRRAATLASSAIAAIAVVVSVSVVTQSSNRPVRHPPVAGSPTPSTPGISSDSAATTTVPAPGTGLDSAVAATVQGVEANALVSVGDDVWAADSTAGELIQVSTKDNRIVSRHPVGAGSRPAAIDLVEDGSALWTHAGKLQRVDPASGKTTLTITAGDGGNIHGLAFGGGYLWSVCCIGKSLQQIDPVSGRIVATVPLLVQSPGAGVAVGHGAVWVNDVADATVMRYDPVSRVDANVTVPSSGGNHQGNIAVTDDAVWVETGDGLARIDPSSREVTATIPLPPSATVYDMAGDGTTLWVVGNKANRLWRIDSPSARITGVLEVTAPQAVVATAGAVWVSNGSSLLRINPNGMRPAESEPTPDPGTFEVEGIIATVPPGWHALSLGTQMVMTRGLPGIALATDTYTFGSEEMESDGVLLTIVPDYEHASAAGEADALPPLGPDDLITGAGVPRGRTIARRFVKVEGIPFLVQAHFGKEPIDGSDFLAVNQVLRGVRITPPGNVAPPTGSVTATEFQVMGVGTTDDVTRKGAVVQGQTGFDGLFADSYHLADKAPRLPSGWGAMFVSLPPASCPQAKDVVRVEVVQLLQSTGSTYLAVVVVDPALKTRECASKVATDHSVFAVAVPQATVSRLTGAATRFADEPLLLPPGTH